MIVYITVPVVTKASFSPKNALGDEYKDLATEQAEQMMDDIITEVNIIIIMFQAIKGSVSIRDFGEHESQLLACYPFVQQ